MIERIVSHGREECFALFERSVAPDPAIPLMRVLIFRPTSAAPIASRSLPFRLLNVIPYLTSAASEHIPSFTFVGITDSWNVVIFGDDARVPEEDGAAARGLPDGAVSAKMTLLQDIFGKSAFVDLTAKAAQPAFAATRPGKSIDVSQIFDAPAHLMPPLETLFDDVMRGYLSERPAEQLKDEDEALDAVGDEDVEMDVGGPEEPLIVNAPPQRIVDQHEMNTFVELFRRHAIKCVYHSNMSLRFPF